MKSVLAIAAVSAIVVAAGAVVAYRKLAIPPGDPARGLSRAGQATFDHATFDQLLRRHVAETGRVNYTALKAEQAELDAYLAAIARADVASLSRDEQLALFINAYNAFTLKLILEHLGRIKSIKDLDRPWSTPRWVVGGKTYTLGKRVGEHDGIEHNVLRGSFGEARIHFAVNCASVSCPELTPWAYTGREVQQQLEARARAFAANPKHVRIAGGVLKLSKIMRWYAGDFKDKAGSVEAYLKMYAPAGVVRFIDEHGGTPPLEYLDYDWSLNGS